MNMPSKFARLAVVGLLTFVMAGCATARDRRAENTVIGAGLGAAAGAMISQGDPAYTLGGAAAGGLLGNILTDERRYHHRDWDRGRHYHPPRRHVHRPKHYHGKGHYKGRGHYQSRHHSRPNHHRHHRR